MTYNIRRGVNNDMAKHYFYIKKMTQSVTTSQGNVNVNVFGFSDASCRLLTNLKEGTTVKVVAGKKIPIGTLATVDYAKKSRFENSFNPLNAAEVETSVFVTLPNGEKVWTSGRNLIEANPAGKLSDFIITDNPKPSEKDFEFLKKNFPNSKEFTHVEGEKVYLERPGLKVKVFELDRVKNVKDFTVLTTKDKNLFISKSKVEPGNILIQSTNAQDYDKLDVNTIDSYLSNV